MPLSAPAAYPAIVIGGGISGLVCAYQLQRAGIPVRVLEAGSRPGGVIATIERDGFRFDLGPQSFLSTEPLLALIDALGLKDQLLHADPRAPRYILVGGQLVPAPLAPPSLLKTPLFSAGTKWRLLSEILQHTKPPEQDESIAAFVRRKFGAELLERLVGPFVSGIYAGDPEKLSLRAAFPKIHEFEQQYGSVLRGAMKSRPAKGTPRAGLCSFREGMATLPRALAARLGESLLLDTSVTGLHHGTANGKLGFEVSVVRGKQHEILAASAVVIATPANIASLLVLGLSDELAPVFSRIEYAPVAVVSACFRREQFARPPDGFGFLVPRSEGLHVLGTVFNYSLFAGRAPEGMVCLTSFAGGATDPKFCEWSDDAISETIASEVARVLGITGRPVATNLQRYARALPQYNLGHTQTIESLKRLATTMPELFLAGNYLSGPSIGACVEQATRTAQEARSYLASIGAAGVGTVAHA
ncbi:MAG TPA: protoporphyrinogen oxidase [Candidatus Acidoferrales bacterium]|nr:protoporphyrinogen oxidase [Candidatus Acidoferrales bacterium]